MRRTISQAANRPAVDQHLRDLATLRRVRDRIDREYAQPLDVEALARGAHMSAGHLSRQFRLAFGESPVQLPDDAADRARDGAPSAGRPQRHRDLLRGRLLVAGHLQHQVHRAGRHASQRLPARGDGRDGRDATVRRETSDQTGQESRSEGRRAAASLIVMSDITIHASFLPHDDPEASVAFYRDTLGFQVRMDVEYGGMHWITVGPADQPGTSIVLYPPAATPGITEDERRTVAEMMAKGTFSSILLATKDVDGTFERLQAGDAEVVQEPTDQPYGVRDCAFRDPAGNLIRIQELT